jgi:hypothetical protein
VALAFTISIFPIVVGLNILRVWLYGLPVIRDKSVIFAFLEIDISPIVVGPSILRV